MFSQRSCEERLALPRPSPFGIAFACICQAAVAQAAITSRAGTFASICTDQQATAFVWQDGDWQAMAYFPNIYTLTKGDGASAACADLLKSHAAVIAALVNVSYGCYRITPFAQGAGPLIACSELWASAAGDAPLQSVTCAGNGPYDWIVFDPAGNFQFVRLGSDLSDTPRDDNKEPLILSVGRCVVARQIAPAAGQ